MTAIEVENTSNGPGLPAAMAALGKLRGELKAAFLERDPEIDAILVALLAEEHVLLLGPWGTAKSALTNVIAQALGSTYYSMLLTKHTTPEEPFGPWDLPRMKEGIYRRVTIGRFPEAQVAFLDEIFKSSSAILNGFLTALNERMFDNGGIRQAIPLQVCIAASNELPQDESLGALFDRFLLRRYTRYISDRDNRRKLLTMRGEPEITARLSSEDLECLRVARRAVDCTATVEPMLEIGDSLAAEGFEVSDRRWRKLVKLVQAAAVLRGATTADTEDLLILADALWDNPDDAAKIYGVVAKAVSPDMQKALELLDSATELWTKAAPEKLDPNKPEQLQAMATLHKGLKQVKQDVARLRQTGAVVEATAKIERMHKYVAEKVQKAVMGNW